MAEQLALELLPGPPESTNKIHNLRLLIKDITDEVFEFFNITHSQLDRADIYEEKFLMQNIPYGASLKQENNCFTLMDIDLQELIKLIIDMLIFCLIDDSTDLKKWNDLMAKKAIITKDQTAFTNVNSVPIKEITELVLEHLKEHFVQESKLRSSKWIEEMKHELGANLLEGDLIHDKVSDEDVAQLLDSILKKDSRQEIQQLPLEDLENRLKEKLGGGSSKTKKKQKGNKNKAPEPIRLQDIISCLEEVYVDVRFERLCKQRESMENEMDLKVIQSELLSEDCEEIPVEAVGKIILSFKRKFLEDEFAGPFEAWRQKIEESLKWAKIPRKHYRIKYQNRRRLKIEKNDPEMSYLQSMIKDCTETELNLNFLQQLSDEKLMENSCHQIYIEKDALYLNDFPCEEPLLEVKKKIKEAINSDIVLGEDTKQTILEKMQRLEEEVKATKPLTRLKYFDIEPCGSDKVVLKKHFLKNLICREVKAREDKSSELTKKTLNLRIGKAKKEGFMFNVTGSAEQMIDSVVNDYNLEHPDNRRKIMGYKQLNEAMKDVLESMKRLSKEVEHDKDKKGALQEDFARYWIYRSLRQEKYLKEYLSEYLVLQGFQQDNMRMLIGNCTKYVRESDYFIQLPELHIICYLEVKSNRLLDGCKQIVDDDSEFLDQIADYCHNKTPWLLVPLVVGFQQDHNPDEDMGKLANSKHFIRVPKNKHTSRATAQEQGEASAAGLIETLDEMPTLVNRLLEMPEVRVWLRWLKTVKAQESKDEKATRQGEIAKMRNILATIMILHQTSYHHKFFSGYVPTSNPNPERFPDRSIEIEANGPKDLSSILYWYEAQLKALLMLRPGLEGGNYILCGLFGSGKTLILHCKYLQFCEFFKSNKDIKLLFISAAGVLDDGRIECKRAIVNGKPEWRDYAYDKLYKKKMKGHNFYSVFDMLATLLEGPDYVVSPEGFVMEPGGKSHLSFFKLSKSFIEKETIGSNQKLIIFVDELPQASIEGHLEGWQLLAERWVCSLRSDNKEVGSNHKELHSEARLIDGMTVKALEEFRNVSKQAPDELKGHYLLFKKGVAVGKRNYPPSFYERYQYYCKDHNLKSGEDVCFISADGVQDDSKINLGTCNSQNHEKDVFTVSQLVQLALSKKDYKKDKQDCLMTSDGENYLSFLDILKKFLDQPNVSAKKVCFIDGLPRSTLKGRMEEWTQIGPKFIWLPRGDSIKKTKCYDYGLLYTMEQNGWRSIPLEKNMRNCEEIKKFQRQIDGGFKGFKPEIQVADGEHEAVQCIESLYEMYEDTVILVHLPSDLRKLKAKLGEGAAVYILDEFRGLEATNVVFFPKIINDARSRELMPVVSRAVLRVFILIDIQCVCAFNDRFRTSFLVKACNRPPTKAVQAYIDSIDAFNIERARCYNTLSSHVPLFSNAWLLNGHKFLLSSPQAREILIPGKICISDMMNGFTFKWKIECISIMLKTCINELHELPPEDEEWRGYLNQQLEFLRNSILNRWRQLECLERPLNVPNDEQQKALKELYIQFYQDDDDDDVAWQELFDPPRPHSKWFHKLLIKLGRGIYFG